MAEEVFHEIPRLSASGMHRVFACSPSYTKAWEAYDLRSRYGVPDPEVAKEAIDGTQRHLLLSAIPFSSTSLGLGPRLNLHEAVKAEAQNLGIRFDSPADYWFCYNAILKRNRLIAHVIEQLGPATVEKITIRLDEGRLFRHLALADGARAELSGLPDVAAQIRTRSGQLHAVICDYKSGWKEQTPAPQNKQLLTLAHLLDHQEPLSGCYVSLFAKTHRNNYIDAAYFDRPLLDQAGQLLAKKTRAAAELHQRYRTEIPSAFAERPLSPDLAATLDAASRVDPDHCTMCSGKACCSKLRQQAVEFKRNELDPNQPLVDAYRGIKRRMKATKKNPQGASMTAEELSGALGQVRRVTDQIKLFTSLDKELSDIAREMINNGNEIPGVTLEQGRERLAIKEGTTANEVVERIQKILPALDKAEFIDNFASLRLADVRAYLAEALNIQESEVLKGIEESLKEANPFCLKPDQPSVKVNQSVIGQSIGEVESEELQEQVTYRN
jgi:hypothetical protein